MNAKKHDSMRKFKFGLFTSSGLCVAGCDYNGEADGFSSNNDGTYFNLLPICI